MEKLVEKIIKIDLNEIETYDFPMNEAFGLEITFKETKFCFIIRFSSNNKNLICCGTGAQNRDKKTSNGTLKKPPYLDRWSWFKYFDESFMVYADPTFFNDEKITLGWLVGGKNHWYADTIAEIIKKLALNQKIVYSNILFYGSSGGGFTSICLGTLIRKSKVLINNSQFTIINYKKYHINNLLRVLKKEFPELTESEIIENLNYRLNTIELFKKENYIPQITYYVNTESTEDIDKHCIPFINDIKEIPCFNNELTVHFYKEEKESPHGPLPTEKSVELIKFNAKRQLYNL